MMIKFIYDKIYKWFQKKDTIIFASNDTILSQQNILDPEHICSLSFKLTKNEEIDIQFSHIDTNNLSSDDIIILSEQYANLMVLIHNGLLKKEFTKTLKNYKKQHIDDININLLIDNVLVFNNLLEQKLKVLKKELDPLVRPSSVFK